MIDGWDVLFDCLVVGVVALTIYAVIMLLWLIYIGIRSWLDEEEGDA